MERIRRAIAGQLHRLAWWIDRQADRIWNIDAIIRRRLLQQASMTPAQIMEQDGLI